MKKKLYFFLFFLPLLPLAAESSREEVVKELFQSVEYWMGTPYVYGGYSKNGIDCSGFTSQVYRSVFEMELPRTVSAQKHLGTPVTGKLQPGDLVFFLIDGKISHVGIYVFDRKFIHAASAGPSVGVIKSSLDEKYYKTRYAYARRLVKLPGGQEKIEVASEKESGEKSEKIVQDQPNSEEVVDLKIGTVLYRGRLYEEQMEFDGNKKIVISLTNLRDKEKNFTIEITNLNNGYSKRLHLFDLNSNDPSIQKLELMKGEYLVEVKGNNTTVMTKKKIRVL